MSCMTLSCPAYNTIDCLVKRVLVLHRAGEGTDKQARQRVRSHTRAPDQITPFRGQRHRRCRFVSELFANEGDSMPQGHLATHRPFLMLATACWGGGEGAVGEEERCEEECACVRVTGI